MVLKMTTEIESGRHTPPVNGSNGHMTSSGDGLGYSRHYAQRIRELGKTSRESWIKRLWNHMFGASREQESNSEDSRERRRTSSTDDGDASKEMQKHGDVQRSGSPEPSSHTKEVRFKETDAKNADESEWSTRTDAHSASAGRHVGGSRPYSARDKALEGLPAQLLNSPYLPPRDRHDFYRSLRFRDSGKDSRVKSRYMNHLSKSTTTLGPGSLNPHRQTHPYLSQVAREQGSVTAPVKPKVTRDASVIQLEKRAKTTSDRATKFIRDFCPMNIDSSRSLHVPSPLSGLLDKLDDVRDDELTPELPDEEVHLDKEQEETAAEFVQEAVECSKIFTCDAPYPVDAFVRISLRKRGWVEKFGPKVTNATAMFTSPDKLEVNSDEDYQLICDVGFPKPWEEDNGLYAIMSRMVHRLPAKFIWGGKSVNGLVLKSDVTVNHFPKAKYFSSKVLLALSLRDLAWHNNTDPLAFFPRCYVLNDDDKQDIIDDFHMTACMALLKLVLEMYDPNSENPLLPGDANNPGSDAGFQDDTGKNQECREDESLLRADGDIHTDVVTNAVEDAKLSKKRSSGNGPVDGRLVSSGSGGFLEKSDSQDGHDTVEEVSSQCAADISDDVDDKSVIMKASQVKVVPDLKAMSRERRGGIVPVKAVDWAITQCNRFIGSKNHEDIDSKVKRGLFPGQWNQLMTWFYQVSQDGATVSISEDKLKKCETLLKNIKEVWPQYDIDGARNIWIVKPGDKSKGIGISFCDNLDEILKIAKNQGTQEYIVQKYIERPLLIHRCKFDIRQWFLVTNWLPLTIWFYRTSYLRICSQEFNYESMHESIHLSNVAVQENYLNGKRSEKLPENNFMTSDQFIEYLSEIGAGGVWEENIYPGMKEAVINTLIATQEVTNHRKSAFELYGADFMMSEDYKPWLLEVNSSPGMLPSSVEKARLCASVIEDTIKVVLDHRENSGCDTGEFELIYHDTTNPNTRGLDSKLLLEGQHIKQHDLQRFAMIDQKAMKIEKDREDKAREKERRRGAKAEAEGQAAGDEGDRRRSESTEHTNGPDSGCETSYTDAESSLPNHRSPSTEENPEPVYSDGKQGTSSGIHQLAGPRAAPTSSNKPKMLASKQPSRSALRSSITEIYGGSANAGGRTKTLSTAASAKSKIQGKTLKDIK